MVWLGAWFYVLKRIFSVVEAVARYLYAWGYLYFFIIQKSPLLPACRLDYKATNLICVIAVVWSVANWIHTVCTRYSNSTCLLLVVILKFYEEMTWLDIVVYKTW